MAISKTENETYRLRLYYPQDIQERLGSASCTRKHSKQERKRKTQKLISTPQLKRFVKTMKKTPLS